MELPLAAITAEMQQPQGSRITKIYQPGKRDIVLHCRQPGISLPVVLSADPQNPRAYIASAVPDNPLNPPSFCMLLRKYLEGGKILSVLQPDLERILEITIENTGEAGELAQYRLITEIMGRHSNIVLIDCSDTILDAINRVDSRVNRYRQILPGAVYIPPPDQGKISPLLLDWQRFLDRVGPTSPKARLSRIILDNFAGIGPRTAQELVHQAGYNPKDLKEEIDDQGLRFLYNSLTSLAKVLEQRGYTPQVILDTEGHPQAVSAIPLYHLSQPAQIFDSMSAAVENYFTKKIAEQRMASWRNNLLRLMRHIKAVWVK